ncbi:hypothetical protein DFJ77DRAFT_459314 [Powellomyces hirtus]|nr:hypothetical protein DFJ77DRAFT_459314 [Powellomyces hirtus]
MDPSLPARLRFLHEASHSLHAVHPSLSRHLLASLTDVCAVSATPLPEKLTKRFCSRCCSLFVPGTSTHVQVKELGKSTRSAQRRRRTGKASGELGQFRRTSGESHPSDPIPIGDRPTELQKRHTKPRIIINGLGRTGNPKAAQQDALVAVKGKRKRARLALQPGALLTCVSCQCTVCSAETRIPGKTAENEAQLLAALAAQKRSVPSAVGEDFIPIPQMPAADLVKAPSSASSHPQYPRAALETPSSSRGSMSPAPAMAPAGKIKKKDKRKNELRSLLAKKDSEDGAKSGLTLTDFLSSL